MNNILKNDPEITQFKYESTDVFLIEETIYFCVYFSPRILFLIKIRK